jgi:hypothetical protein
VVGGLGELVSLGGSAGGTCVYGMALGNCTEDSIVLGMISMGNVGALTRENISPGKEPCMPPT